MGNCDCHSKPEEEKKISIVDFKMIYAIGKGGFGKVWKVKYRKSENEQIYSMKQMSKVTIYEKKSIQSIKDELQFLARLYHPFITNMHYAFQDTENLYIVMDYLSGGDLRYYINQSKRRSTENEAIFVAGCVLLALDYIHSLMIIHRDIKPENLVFDDKGYLHLTDFGISKVYDPTEPLIDSSGTPGYMAPEILRHKSHEFGADFFALGVILYELVMGERPYKGKTRKEMKEEILYFEITLKKSDLPDGWSPHAVDFINKMIKRRKNERLGYVSINEIKNHPWLKTIDWTLLLSKEMPSPFIIPEGDNFDQKYANRVEEIDLSKRDYYLYKINSNQIFQNYYYDKTIERKESIKMDRITQYETKPKQQNDKDSSNLLLLGEKKNSLIQIKIERKAKSTERQRELYNE